MDNQLISQRISTLKALLQDASSIGILVTEYQTLDKVGAGLALFLALQEAGKNVQIVSKKDPLVEISNLVGIDKLVKNFGGVTKKLVVSLPYHEGEVEKVSYNIEGNRLNINLFATKDKGISFNERDVDFIKSGSNPSVIITIGIRKQEEMAGFVASDSDVKIVRLDTVVPQQDFGEITLAGNEFSSISEIVTLIIRELGLPVNVDIAQNLMDGVVNATNNFSAQQTSSAAFASAAYLLAHNARRRSTRTDSRQSDSRQEQRRSSVKQDTPRVSQPVEGVGPSQKQQEMASEATVSEQESSAAQVTTFNSDRQSEQVAPDSSGVSVQEKEEEVPSDWFVPKVFKSSKPQE